jgi:hypothetical protein
MEKLFECVGLKVFSQKPAHFDNCSDGERHVIFEVGTSNKPTHRVDVRWNDYGSTDQHVDTFCGVSKIPAWSLSIDTIQ